MVKKKPDILKGLYKYDPDNKKTWKYIDYEITGSEQRGSLKFVRWILNPGFKYGNKLSKGAEK